jgi:hypothetical protein
MPAPVSAEQVQIYVDFRGDDDAYQRRGSPHKETLADAWGTIEQLRQRLFQVSAGHASPTFRASAEADLNAWTVDAAARRLILSLVESDVASHKDL